MKAIVVVPRKREVALIDHDVPRVIEPSQVKLRMLDVGVCGTDREICAFQYGTPPVGESRLVIGHESLGEVVEVGAAVSRLNQGGHAFTATDRACLKININVRY